MRSFHFTVRVALFLLLIGAVAIPLSAAAPAAQATRPATQAGPAVALKFTITKVTGMVQVRAEEDKPWQPAKEGMELGEGAEFRTGPRSSVSFKIPPDQVITLDRLGTVKVLEAIKTSETNVKTDLGMKYGRTNYKVEGAGVEHDTTIRSPAATLAVRGTDEFQLFDMPPFVPSGYTNNTLAKIVNNANKTYGGTKEVTFGGDGEQNQTGENASVQDQQLADGSVDGGDSSSRDPVETFLIKAHSLLNGNDNDSSGNPVRSLDNFGQIQDNIGAQTAQLVTRDASIDVTLFDNDVEDGDFVNLLRNGNPIANNIFLRNLNSESGPPAQHMVALPKGFTLVTVQYASSPDDLVTVGVKLGPSDPGVATNLLPPNSLGGPSTKTFLIYRPNR